MGSFTDEAERVAAAQWTMDDTCQSVRVSVDQHHRGDRTTAQLSISNQDPQLTSALSSVSLYLLSPSFILFSGSAQVQFDGFVFLNRLKLSK